MVITTGNLAASNSWGNSSMSCNNWCCSSPEATTDSVTIKVCFSRCHVGINCCNEMLFLRRFFFRNMVCNNIVSNGSVLPRQKLHCSRFLSAAFGITDLSDSVKRHLRGRHLCVLNLKLNFIFDGGCTREEQIGLSLKRHLFPHGGRKPEAFLIYFSTLPPILNILLIF